MLRVNFIFCVPCAWIKHEDATRNYGDFGVSIVKTAAYLEVSYKDDNSLAIIKQIIFSVKNVWRAEEETGLIRFNKMFFQYL